MVNYGALAAGMPDVGALKRSVNLAGVVMADGVALEPDGEGRLLGLCPFHLDSSPSFSCWMWPDGAWASVVGVVTSVSVTSLII